MVKEPIIQFNVTLLIFLKCENHTMPIYLLRAHLEEERLKKEDFLKRY